MEEDLSGAIELLQRGLEIVEDNPRLLGALGTAYVTYSFIRFAQRDDYLQKAEDCAAKIFANDPDSIHGHRVLGWVTYKRGNPGAAIPHMKKVVRVDPGDHGALFLLPTTYSNAGSVQASEQLVERFLDVDPLSPWSHWTLGWLRHVQGRFREAVEAFERAKQLEPENPIFRFHCAHSMAAEGRGKDAFSVLEPIVRDAAPYFAPWARFLGSAFRGDVAAATQATQAMTQDARDWVMDDEMASVIHADALATMEASSDALDALENALDHGFFNYPYLAEHDPALEVMRGDPRLTRLLERVRQEWERFEA